MILQRQKKDSKCRRSQVLRGKEISKQERNRRRVKTLLRPGREGDTNGNNKLLRDQSLKLKLIPSRTSNKVYTIFPFQRHQQRKTRTKCSLYSEGTVFDIRKLPQAISPLPHNCPLFLLLQWFYWTRDISHQRMSLQLIISRALSIL